MLTNMMVKAMGGVNLSQYEEAMATTPEEEAAAKEKSRHPQSTERLQQDINSYITSLGQLDRELRAIPAPRPAYDFARAYENSLVQYASAILAISQAVQAQNIDISAKALGGQKDQALTLADKQLVTLCDKYGINKPFDVSDTHTGSVTGGPGG